MKPMLVMWTYVVFLFAIPGVVEGQISVTLTDKEGQPRANRRYIYNIRGINIDQPGIEVPLLRNVPAAQRRLTADAAGTIRIPLPTRELSAESVKEALLDSKQITVELSPQPLENAPDLAPLSIDLLLGDRSQNMHIVAMEARYGGAEPAMDDLTAVDRFAYESCCGRFHLLGDYGTALYRPHGGNRWALAGLMSYREDDRYLYYQEVGNPNRRWAFSRVAVCYTQRKCGRCVFTRSYRRKVWLYDPDRAAKWKPFCWATRICAHRPDD